MAHAESVSAWDLLGIPTVVRKQRIPLAGLHLALREGLPYSAIEEFQRRAGFTQGELSEAMRVPLRTLSRRRLKRRLTGIESDRLYRIASVVELAADVLGSVQAARTWLGRPNRALGAEAPLALLDTEVGAQQVRDVLERVRHGMFS